MDVPDPVHDRLDLAGRGVSFTRMEPLTNQTPRFGPPDPPTRELLMRNTSDASWHKTCEQDILAHIEKLLHDDRFVIDTSIGRKTATSIRHTLQRSDRSVELKRQMSQVRPDRDLETRMPVGQTIEATFSVTKWFFLEKIIARLVVTVIPPTRELLKDQPPEPMSTGETRRQLAALPPASSGVPTTIVLVSTSGFEPDARELAERTSERTVVLVEPNASGGWSIYTPSELSGIKHLFDPEPESSKTRRIEQAIQTLQDDLITGSISAEKLALMTDLPLQQVEDAVKSYVKRSTGLQCKRLDGRLLLFREGITPTGKAVGGEGMSMLDRLKTLFARKGENQRKITFLSERRAALTQQRDTFSDEIFRLEKKESELRKEFKDNDSVITRKRITSQLLQLRKEIERRSQLLGVLNQQINVVGTHLHNLQLLEQGRTAQLPPSDQIAADAAAAEEMLAQLQADSELADALSPGASSGMSLQEQALYEELLRESTGGVATTSETSSSQPTDPIREPSGETAPSKTEPDSPDSTDSTTRESNKTQQEPG